MAEAFLRAVIAACLVAGLDACASSRDLGSNVSDLGANAQLKGVLVADRKHDYSDIDLTIFDGRLMLTGTMRSEGGRARLNENAWKASGVTLVIDEVIIDDKTSIGRGFKDARLDQTIRAKLLASDSVTSANYKISVSRGVVYLIGVARDEKELAHAIELARETSGVAGVVHHVVLQTLPGPPASSSALPKSGYRFSGRTRDKTII